MIKHVVMWKLKDKALGRGKKENAVRMKEMLEGLQTKIAEIEHIEVGINISEGGYDIVLVSEFQDKDSLQKYLNHPEHKKVGEFVSKVREERISADYLVYQNIR